MTTKLLALALPLAFLLPGAAGASAIESTTLDLDQTSFDVPIVNQSNSKLIGNLQLAAGIDQLVIPAEGHVKCGKKKKYDFSKAWIAFGPVNPTFGSSNALYPQEYAVSHTTWTGLLNGWLTEAAGESQYVVPLSELLDPQKPNAHFDPVASFQEAMQAFIQNGGTALDYLKVPRTVPVQRTVGLIGVCVDTQAYELDAKVQNESITLKLQWPGDPQLKLFEAQFVGGGGGIQMGQQPVNITDAELIPLAPSYVGPCPKQLTFRARFQGSGQGEVRFRVRNENTNTVYLSPKLAFDANNGPLTHDFQVELPAAAPIHLNKTFDHEYDLSYWQKPHSTMIWPSQYQTRGPFPWKHRCTPQVAVGGSGGGGFLSGGQPQGQKGGIDGLKAKGEASRGPARGERREARAGDAETSEDALEGMEARNFEVGRQRLRWRDRMPLQPADAEEVGIGGCRYEVSFELRNPGKEPVANLMVELGDLIPLATWRDQHFAPGQRRRLRQHVELAPGTHRLQVRLEDGRGNAHEPRTWEVEVTAPSECGGPGASDFGASPTVAPPSGTPFRPGSRRVPGAPPPRR